MGQTQPEPIQTEVPNPPPKDPGQEDYENALKELSNGKADAAVNLLKKAIEEDHPKARIQLGLMYRDGIGVEANPKEAMELFQGSPSDDGVGDVHMAFMFLKGSGVERNYNTARDMFIKAIDKDNMDAQSHLGFLYVTGREGFATDKQEGMRLLTEASEQSAEADAYLGLMHMEGIGVPTNYAKAIEHLTKAVDKGHLNSHIYLAELHMQGKGTDRNPWAAAKLLLRAAEKGHARAQCYIGVMYRDGIGVTQNQKVAQKWLQSSANLCDTLGMYSWGKFLLDNNIEWDWMTVVDWLNRAASKGNSFDGDLYDELYIDGLARVFKIEVQ